jgi:hypothetical protein
MNLPEFHPEIDPLIAQVTILSGDSLSCGPIENTTKTSSPLRTELKNEREKTNVRRNIKEN